MEYLNGACERLPKTYRKVRLTKCLQERVWCALRYNKNQTNKHIRLYPLPTYLHVNIKKFTFTDKSTATARARHQENREK